MLRRVQEAIATRHRPPRGDIAELQTRIDVARVALIEISDVAANLAAAQTLADTALTLV